MKYSTAPTSVSAKNWIGLYPAGKKAGDQPAIDWKYAPEAAGSVTLATTAVPGPGTYDGYTALAGPLTFTIT